jgi:putative transposase
MCQLAQVSRAGFYRYLDCRAPEEADMAVRSAIQEIALEHERYYGYRRVTAELRRRGMMVNHKCVVRIMRTDNLLTKERSCTVNYPGSSDPDHFQMGPCSRRLRDTVPIILSQPRVHPPRFQFKVHLME